MTLGLQLLLNNCFYYQLIRKIVLSIKCQKQEKQIFYSPGWYICICYLLLIIYDHRYLCLEPECWSKWGKCILIIHLGGPKLRYFYSMFVFFKSKRRQGNKVHVETAYISDYFTILINGQKQAIDKVIHFGRLQSSQIVFRSMLWLSVTVCQSTQESDCWNI